jgi:hypothetical protein
LGRGNIGQQSLHHGWLWLILLTAVCLRLYQITDVPPGLTHDEADHGISAWGVVNGQRPIYFTVGYGREPLYDYLSAGLMALLGPTYLAGRLTAVFFSLLLIPVLFIWVRHTFTYRIALLTTAGLALSFWPQMTGRQMLRSTILPPLFTLAVYFFWQGMEKAKAKAKGEDASRIMHHTVHQLPNYPITQLPITNYLLSGLFLGLTFYTYLPARVLWLLFPALLVFWFLANRPLFHQTWRSTLLVLFVAGLVGLPLFYYLTTHPGVEVRVEELSAPLTAAFRGDFAPLWHNTRDSLRIFTSEGDSTWRYNIPGQPFFNPVMGFFFYLGLLIALWQTIRHRHMPSFCALVWLLLGLSPSLITGPELATTQAIGTQPVLYLFPAIALGKLGDWEIRGLRNQLSPITPYRLLITAYCLLFTFTAVSTFYNYFIIWANEPAVRVQYETTMMTAMRYLNEHGTRAAAVSTTTPGQFHSPALAQMTLHNPNITLRWFDARASLVWPDTANSILMIPGFTPLAPGLVDYLKHTAVFSQSLSLRATDADRPLNIYQVKAPEVLLTYFETVPTTIIGDHLAELLGYDLQTATVQPGEPVHLATLWRVYQPLPEAILFTHMLAPDGTLLAQADRLDVPSYGWQAGDIFVQLHELIVPEATAAGNYPLSIGLYLRGTRQRLPISTNNEPIGDHLPLTTVTIRGDSKGSSPLR